MEKMKYYVLKYKQKKIIIACSILIVSILLLIGYNAFKTDKKASKVVQNSDALNVKTRKAVEEVEEVKDNYYVDIKGAIINPGVYSLASGNRVIDVIKMAGGLTEEADTSVLNLSKLITDEMTIVIYTKKEIEDYKKQLNSNNTSEVIAYAEKENSCPDESINDACFGTNTTNDDNNNAAGTSSKISINNASLETLQTLSGIGESKAKAIITYREENGSFKTIEDIMNVSGIGEALFAKIKENITI